MRHGESVWNRANIFTGTADVALTARGASEALEGGLALADIDFDVVYTSRLSRAVTTALLAMSHNSSGRSPVLMHNNEEEDRGGVVVCGEAESGCSLSQRASLEEAQRDALARAPADSFIPVYQYHALNERYYGVLQGLSKREAESVHGEEQVQLWRRGYHTRPPGGESLAEATARVIKFLDGHIKPRLKNGDNILVASHGNVIRGILMHLYGMTPNEVLQVEVSTGKPIGFRYQIDQDEFEEVELGVVGWRAGGEENGLI